MKVAVVGAGPAGVLLATCLQERFPQVELHLHEASTRAGGQAECAEHDGIAHPYGTCFTHLGYRDIHRLLKRAGVATGIASRTIHVLRPGGELQALEGGIVDKLGMLASVAKLMRVRRAWRLADQESNPTWPENGQPFAQFLHDRGIALTSDLFKIATTGQLYGPPEAITTHNALQWFTPALFATAAMRKVRYLPGGFDAFFNGLLASTGAAVSYCSRVTAVVPEPGGVKLMPQGTVHDACFVTAPLDSLDTPASARLASAGPYADQHVVSLHLRTSVPMSQRRIYAFGVTRFVHVVSAVPLGDESPSRVHWVLARFQSGEAALDDATVVARVLAELREIGGFGEIEVVGLRRFRYNIHYSARQLAAGLPQAIDALQGRGGVWYGGGALSHWNVESIALQSCRLVERFAHSVHAGAVASPVA